MCQLIITYGLLGNQATQVKSQSHVIYYMRDYSF